MHSAERNLKKSTGIYRCVDDIANLSIRLQLREIINENVGGASETKDLESKNFRWQQKHFGKWERNFYKDKNNCVTDLDQNYHREVLKILDSDELLYSYVNLDEFCLQEEVVCNSKNVTFVLKKEDSDADNARSKYDMMEHYFECIKNPFFVTDYEYMYVMADFGEYVGDTWIKSEYILCALKYDPKKKVLLIYPDFTNSEPYRFSINHDLTKTYEYTLENIAESVNPEILDKEQKILDKIASHERKMKEQIIGMNFAVPPRNKLFVHLFCEILMAKHFEYNDVYIQYFIDLPKHWSCLDQTSLKGTTQACHTKNDDLAHFGFPFETVLCYDIEKIGDAGTFSTPYIYFEVISKDSWERYRTEGLSYLNLPISQPGKYSFELQCLRILPRNLSGNLRRFFIGDYQSYDDITWISKPKEHNDFVLNKYGVDTLGTGQLLFRMNVVHQSQAFLEDIDKSAGDRRERIILDKLASSSLIKSVEQVLEVFKRARRNMVEARKRV